MLCREKRHLYALRFNESVPLCEVKVDLPFVVDRRNNVIIGHSLREQHFIGSLVECIIVDNDDYILQPYVELELALMEENDRNRIKTIEQEINMLLQTFNNDVEAMRLFDLPPDDSLITEATFKQPPAYNFEKGKRKEEEGDALAGLFSSVGDG